MGIKSTRTLSRSQALELYDDLMKELYGIRGPTNRELATMLEELSDLRAEREDTVNFDNFHVMDDDDYEDAKRRGDVH